MSAESVRRETDFRLLAILLRCRAFRKTTLLSDLSFLLSARSLSERAAQCGSSCCGPALWSQPTTP